MAMKDKGFTLIELLVVISVMGIIGFIGVDLFSSVIRGSNKANVINEVKQNSQQVLDVMERYIRNAKDASVSDGNLTLTLKMQNDENTVFKCDMSAVPNGKITLQQGSGPTRDLTNIHPQSGVDVNSCQFSLSGVKPKVIKIDLTLDQGAQAATRKEFEANVKLSTTVSLRTY